MKKSTKKKIFAIFIVLAFLGSGLISAFLYTTPSQNQVQVDWGARLAITTFGDLYPIPAGVGVTNETTDKLFTLNSDGIIYKTGEESATLVEFFEIWGENFNSTCILEYCNTENHSMRMYVNNVENFDYELYTIKNNDFILIDYR
ncbi:MAG: hypothetical protein GTN36_06140 [Candidatus Aenigmarchaeota archaeon]|nr:hypothetical protein [Candidatus Aenigmarchaeota archaeon]